ncbi:MAG: DUF262 domain-containing protein [Acidimicrobiales bacterium]
MTSTEEKIDFEISSDDEFGSDYEDPGELRAEDVQGTVVYTLDWTVGTIVDQIDSDPDDPETTGVLVTAPPFQRRTAWNRTKQSLFVESLMLGLPVPPLVLAESQTRPGQFYVLDGKQRLTSLARFVHEAQIYAATGEPINKAKGLLKLGGLELLKAELEGKNYLQINDSPTLRGYNKSLLAQPIRTIVVRNWGTPALLHLIFSRLNRSTVPLASHELRQALYPGKFTNFIARASAESKALLRARRLKEPDFRLRDAETLLRFIAFKTNLPRYRGDLRDFLDRAIKGGNDNFDDVESELDHLVSSMDQGIEAVFEIFDSAAFLRFDGETDRYMARFNVAVFDLMLWHMCDPEVRDLAVENGPEVVQAYESLCTTSTEFASFLTSTTKTFAAADGRIRLWSSALGKVIGKDLDVDSSVWPVLPLAPRATK